MTPSATSRLDTDAVRAAFPILHQNVHGHPLTYLDNASTTQKPQCVIEAMARYYRSDHANVGRGMHALADRAAHAVENARVLLQQHVGATEASEIVFTAGATAALNLLAYSYGMSFVKKGDEVLVTQMEHHANFLPWQRLCSQTGAEFKICPVTASGQLDIEALEQLITAKTKIVAVTYVSNVLGTINPIQRIVSRAHVHGAVVVVDAAQALAHLSLNVAELGCDFMVFSAHKAYGPTGVGALYGKKALLEIMAPYQVGGNTVEHVELHTCTYADIPNRFEAGTLPLASIVGWAEALRWIQQAGYATLSTHEDQLLQRAVALLSEIPGVQLVDVAEPRMGILAFNVQNVHPTDVGLLLDARGIAVRTGHCCAQPLLAALEQPGGVVRVSLAAYNTHEEVDLLAKSVHCLARSV